MGNTEAHKLTILIVDDDSDARTIFSQFMTQAEMTALTAGSGREGLATLLREPVDLVVLDLVMPEVDGVEVLRQIRSHPTLTDIPVIVVTAWDDFGTATRVKDLGAVDYIVKPVFRRKLVSAIRAQLSPRCPEFRN